MRRTVIVSAVWILVVALLPTLAPQTSWVTTASYAGIFAIATLGVVLITGVAGMLSFGQAAFLGLGAYCSAVITTSAHWPVFAGLLAGWLVTASTAWILAHITLRMRGPYLPITTMLWGLAIYFSFTNLDFLGRNDGLSGIPPIAIFGWQIVSERANLSLVWLVALLAFLGLRNVLNSRLGRAMRSLPGGSVMPEAMGVDTVHLKVAVFVYAALLASTAGWLYAHMVRAISPTAFGLNYSVNLVFMAVLGGASQIWGAILGAGILTTLQDTLQTYVPRVMPVSGNFENVLFGILIIAILLKTRQGALPFLQKIFRVRINGIVVPPPIELAKPDQPIAGTVLLEVRRLRRTFGGLVAVNDVSFEIRAGQILAMIGPNGAGKSTIFNLISGVLRATSGEIVLRGLLLTKLRSRQIAALGVSRTFQHVHLVADMSVLENVAIGAHLRLQVHPRRGIFKSMLRLNRDEEGKLLAEAAFQCRRVGLEDVMSARAESLSLGQQRLVEIARALCAAPVLLMLDEPAAGLRKAEKERLATLLSRLRGEGMSVLLVEHDMEFLMELADQVVVVSFGTKLAEGPPQQIQADPAVIEAYLGAG